MTYRIIVLKSRFFLLVALLFTLFQTSGKAQGRGSELPFQGGETLHFILNYTWGGVITDVGSAVCTLSYSNNTFYAVLTGQTYKFYDVFFKVRERFESKFSASTLRPSFFYRNALEGKYRMRNYLYFNDDYSIKSVTRKYDRKPFDTLLRGNSMTFDLLTLFFKSRTMDMGSLPINQRQPIVFAIDKEIYNLYFIYRGREIKKIKGLGVFRTLKFAAKVVAGDVFTGKDDMTIWVSDDDNVIPLLFESPILVGKMQGRLSGVSGNKYPLRSRVK